MSLQKLIENFGDILALLIPIMVAIALLVFVWGLVRSMVQMGGSEAKAEEARNIMKWGLIALFVMVSVWGIVNFFRVNLGLKQALEPIQRNPGSTVRPTPDTNIWGQ